ncbi:MAG: hypothetical protein AAGK78_13100 [Planctomycetota bacterium]
MFVATVVGANQTSLTPLNGGVADMQTAAQAISFRLERALGLPANVAALAGAFLLAIPALFTFHLFRVGFGGAIPTIVQDMALADKISAERERAAANAIRSEMGPSPSAAAATSGTTSLSGDVDDLPEEAAVDLAVTGDPPDNRAGVRDRLSGFLENNPNLSRLRSGAQNLGSRLGARGSRSTPQQKGISLDDLTDEAGGGMKGDGN